MELHLHSTVGITQPNTMKLQGELHGNPIMVLIDSGASHNFISSELVGTLGLAVTPSKEFGVKMGDDYQI